jgi:tetratricopeptide (TPR) repeat protein
MTKSRERTIRGMVLCLLALCHAAAGAGNPDAEKLIEQGDAQVKAMHSPEALALFQQAAKLDPGNADILLRISQQYSNLIGQAKSPADGLDDAKQSLDAAKQAVALAPDNPKAHLALSVAYGRMTDFDDNRTKIEDSRHVKSEAEETLKLNPREDIAYHVLGRWNYGVATLNLAGRSGKGLPKSHRDRPATRDPSRGTRPHLHRDGENRRCPQGMGDRPHPQARR